MKRINYLLALALFISVFTACDKDKITQGQEQLKSVELVINTVEPGDVPGNFKVYVDDGIDVNEINPDMWQIKEAVLKPDGKYVLAIGKVKYGSQVEVEFVPVAEGVGANSNSGKVKVEILEDGIVANSDHFDLAKAVLEPLNTAPSGTFIHNLTLDKGGPETKFVFQSLEATKIDGIISILVKDKNNVVVAEEQLTPEMVEDLISAKGNVQELFLGDLPAEANIVVKFEPTNATKYPDRKYPIMDVKVFSKNDLIKTSNLDFTSKNPAGSVNTDIPPMKIKHILASPRGEEGAMAPTSESNNGWLIGGIIVLVIFGVGFFVLKK